MYDLCGLFFQAEDGIRDLVRSRGLGDVYKRQGTVNEIFFWLERYFSRIIFNILNFIQYLNIFFIIFEQIFYRYRLILISFNHHYSCLLYTSDAADERSSVDLGGRRIIKKKNIRKKTNTTQHIKTQQWNNDTACTNSNTQQHDD